VPIATTDLQLFRAVNMPDTDTGTNGGAIDTLRRVAFTQLAANDDIEVISTSASDTQNCTITARDATGAVTSQTAALTGTTAKIFSTMGAAGVVERVLQVELASAAIGTITVRRSVAGATVGTIAVGERGFMALFRKIASDPSVQVNRYVKCFWKNTHATLSLLGALVKQSADPDARITHALAVSVNDTNTTTDRTTAPGAGILAAAGAGTFDDTDKAVPGTDLAAGAAIGVWFRAQLPAADAPHRTTYDSQLAGSSV
jgi:hypothetical protein